MKTAPILCLAVSLAAAAQPPSPALLETGRRIYEEGVLGSGQPLRGLRAGGSAVSGHHAACIACHQKSGMGLTEGALPVPPVSGPALFGRLELATPGRRPRRAAGVRLEDYHFKTRPPYTEASLAAALRSGVSPAGHAFAYMMPRYELPEPDMAALAAYLRTLSAEASPGADARGLQVATVVAPGIEPVRREAFLGVLRACFEDASGSGEEAQRTRLQVWQLEGPAAAWESQLRERYARRPVFALVSGLGADDWAPVERFCEANQVPCLFPNTDVPGSPGGGRYSFYFHRGVLLEAEVMASHIARQGKAIGRVVVVSGGEGAGARGADALAAALAGRPAVERRTLPEPPALSGDELFAGLGADDALVLWLREPELAALARVHPAPPAAGLLLASGVLGGQDRPPLPAAWRSRLLLTFPYDPPPRWNRRMDFNLRVWLGENNLMPQDERMQGNTLAACRLFQESVLRLRGQYLRDWLVEWIENYPSHMGNAPAAQAFPRFSLGPGQRFSSKGAHVVRFAAPEYERLEPVEDWVVP